jgi:hypothetical protein
MISSNSRLQSNQQVLKGANHWQWHCSLNMATGFQVQRLAPDKVGCQCAHPGGAALNVLTNVYHQHKRYRDNISARVSQVLCWGYVDVDVPCSSPAHSVTGQGRVLLLSSMRSWWCNTGLSLLPSSCSGSG